MLDQLAGRLRQAGLPVAVTTAGDLGGLPAGLGVSAYRIVQEALTNVITHAGTVTTHVRVARTSRDLELDVRNDPPAADHHVAPSDGGRGLLGMRERVAAYRGTIHAGPLPTGGFAVTAHIPSRDRHGVTISVVIADDQALVRSGLAMILRTDADILVAGEAADGAHAVELVRVQPAGRGAHGHPHARRRRAHRHQDDHRAMLHSHQPGS